MYMVRHDDKPIYCDCRETDGQILPRLYEYFM